MYNELMKKFRVFMILIVLLPNIIFAEIIENEKTEVIIIATLHDLHNYNELYSPKNLTEIITNLKPSAILIEADTSMISKDGSIKNDILNDSNFPETKAIDNAAKILNVKQIPFDMPNRNQYYEEINYFPRIRNFISSFKKWIMQKSQNDSSDLVISINKLIEEIEQGCADLYQHGSPRIINSKGHDSINRVRWKLQTEILIELMKTYKNMDQLAKEMIFLKNVWHHRNGIMAGNIRKIASNYEGKRIVITVGNDHRYILYDLLKDDNNIIIKEFWEIK